MTEVKKRSLKDPLTLAVTWFGSGLSPKAPGTMGTLAALPFAYFIHSTMGGIALFGASLALFFTGWALADEYIKRYGGSDPQEIVIDEVAGVFLLLSVMSPNLISYAVGFALFRYFDIYKPWPVSWADKWVKGGLGVMLDDMLAGLYPAIFVLGIKLTFLWAVKDVGLGVAK